MNTNQVTRFGANPLLDLELANKNYVDNAGGGGKTFFKGFVSADHVKNANTTPEILDELTWSATANRDYICRLTHEIKSHATADLNHFLTLPAGATALRGFGNLRTEPANNLNWETNFGASTNDTRQLLVIYGYIHIGATAGDVTYSWSQNISNPTDSTWFQGGMMLVWESP